MVHRYIYSRYSSVFLTLYQLYHSLLFSTLISSSSLYLKLQPKLLLKVITQVVLPHCNIVTSLVRINTDQREKGMISSLFLYSLCKILLWKISVTNFIWPYLHQFFNSFHSLNDTQKPLKKPFDWYQSCFEAINNGWDIRQINR